MQLFHLLYFSQVDPSHGPLTTDQVTSFYEKNRRLDITGMLIHCNGSYLQVMEGRRSDISALLASIFRDDRHTSVTVARAEQTDHRMFGSFDMRFLCENSIPDAYLNLHFSGQTFDPKKLTGTELWSFMVDLLD